MDSLADQRQENLNDENTLNEEGRIEFNQQEQVLFEQDPLNQCVYGDKLTNIKDETQLLVGFTNVNGLRKEKWKEKNRALVKFLRYYKFDIFGLAETNIHWPSLDPIDRWEEHMQGIWESMHHSIAYNTTDSVNQPWQPGGCVQVSCDCAVHRCIYSGTDPSGLGRWCWSRFRGRHDVTLQVITAYRTCNIHNAGEQTAHSQQQ